MRRSTLVFAAAVLTLATQARAAPEENLYRYVADLYAGTPVSNGEAVGAGVAIIRRGHDPIFFTYGHANLAGAIPFTPHTRFEIGSVTKVFTTNLLGQMVDSGAASLTDTLATFRPTVLAPLDSYAESVTLGELASFSAGYRSLAPLCGKTEEGGCLPSGRPTISVYGAHKFANFFRDYTPDPPPPPPLTLPPPSYPPYPYIYSDFSLGLVGLLIAADPSRPLDNRSLDRWNKLVGERLLTPLGMSETSLVVPLTVHNVALGYQMPVLKANLSQTGTISDVVVETEAGPYRSQPSVTVTGGGGNGAVFKTVIDQAGFIDKLCMVSGGSGYVAPPAVGFPSPSDASGFKAIGKALIDDGQVTGVTFANVGAGYSDAIYPVSFTGGQAKGGRPATGYGITVNGGFAYVLITDGGSGYYDPLKVVVQPPEGATNVVPIWAPAGSLTSTLSDMARFATAALGPSEPSPALARISRAFRLAEQPRVCDSTTYYSPAPCADGGPTNGLAWAITPASVPNGLPVTYKDGGIAGFSTQVDLLPSKGIAVVTFVNDFPQSDFDGVENAPGFSAYNLGREMLNAAQLISP